MRGRGGGVGAVRRDLEGCTRARLRDRDEAGCLAIAYGGRVVLGASGVQAVVFIRKRQHTRKYRVTYDRS